MFFGRELVFHWRVAQLGQGEFAAETFMIERHCLGTIAVEKEKGCCIYHIRQVYVGRVLGSIGDFELWFMHSRGAPSN